jgi:glutathione synthase/RimK-type ligase-like ATP-grasp enzyme
MLTQFIVVDRLEDWSPYYPCENVITAESYLASDPSPELPAQVINLCRDYAYLEEGYYCSLLAEARGDRVIPSIRTINDLGKCPLYTLDLSSLEKLLHRNISNLKGLDGDRYELRIYFGRTGIENLQGLARQLFDLFPYPILEVQFKRTEKAWMVSEVNPLSIHQLEGAEQDEFAAALDYFSHKVWKRPRRRKSFSYDLAILANVDEKLPPSNRKALEHFIAAGRHIGIDVDMISKDDYPRLTEYDALFIRETTAVDHHTYQFAQRAEHLHIPAIDDPDSILKCANKVYLSELLQEKEISIPQTMILHRNNPDALSAAVEVLGFPLILKIPDGSFSRGMFKVSTMDEMKRAAVQLFQSSVLVLAQEFMYTDFDWRIGVLGGRPLFACKYYMSNGHWQIYNHAARGGSRPGAFETLAVEQAPAEAIRIALKSCHLVGNGLYGVDIKQSGDRFSVIEINDNPNIDAGVEDAHLGKLMYHRVMEHFFAEMERYRYGTK